MSAATVPGQDPSMEDILASIRKILNEEEAAAPAPPPPDAPPEPPPPVAEPPRAEESRAEEPLELTEAMLVAAPEPPPPEPPPPVPMPVPVPVAPAAPPPVAFAPPPEPPPAPAYDSSEGLVAPATAAAAAAILGQLARTVAAERSSPVHRGGPSIEDVVREELRPLLKDWMDTHLPALMERLVRAEIERVVSRSLG
ncbi:DUF2497 domain-containing protein [Muricoccus nepalensis]|nr:DUF2497 domain-containing protein [Roseomonas nepalensis]